MTGSVSRTWDVLCLGIPVIEFVETAAGTYERMPGGDSARVALAVARSGGSAAVAGRLGADGFGSEFQEMCRREGLADAGLSIDPTAPTAQGFRHLEDHRSVVRPTDDRSAGALMRPGDVQSDAIGAARLIHVSGAACAFAPGIAALAHDVTEQARATGTRTSLDLRLPEQDRNRVPGRLLSRIAEADIVTADLPSARAATGEHGAERLVETLLAFGPRVAVLWMGREGAWLGGPDGRKFIAPFRPGQEGVADVFIGDFLSGLTAGDDLVEAAIRASAAAAHAYPEG